MELKLEEEFRSVKILPGVEKFVNHLVKHNIPMAVSRYLCSTRSKASQTDPPPLAQIATGSKTRNFEIKSSHLGHLFDPFKGKVLCGDDPIRAPLPLSFARTALTSHSLAPRSARQGETRSYHFHRMC